MQSLGTSTENVLLWLPFSKLIHTDITEIINPQRDSQYTSCNTSHFYSRLYVYHLSHSNSSLIRACPTGSEEKD